MGTRHKGPGEEVAALDCFIKLMRAASSVSSAVHKHLAGERLTESQFAVLEALHHLGPMSQKTLSQKILKSGANITTVVDNLESRGLAERKRDSSDRRVVFVHLTPEGREVIQRLFPIHAKRISEAMGKLEIQEQKVLGALCRKLGSMNMPSGESRPLLRSEQDHSPRPDAARMKDNGEGERR